MNPIALTRHSIGAFFGWWFSELSGMLPRRLRRASRRERPRLTLLVNDASAVLLESGGEDERVLARADGLEGPQLEPLRTALRGRRGRRAVALRLAPELGLRRLLNLPLAARGDLDQLLRFEMDRLTPFRADEVVYAHRIAGTDAERREVAVELHVAPKAVAERALAAAGRLGLRPVRMELAAADPGPAGLDLLPRSQDEAGRGSRLNRALLLLMLALAAAAVAVPLHQQRTRAAALEREVAAARAQAEQSLALRERLDKLHERARFVVERKSGRPMTAAVLAELTRLIPDDAYVSQLHLRDGGLQLHGFAATASDLIGLLEQSALFRQPQFRSPVTRDPRAELERFHISAEIGEADN